MREELELLRRCENVVPLLPRVRSVLGQSQPGEPCKGPKAQDSVADGEVVGIRSLTPTCVAAGERALAVRAWPKPSP